MKKILLSSIFIITGGFVAFFGNGQIKDAKQSVDWPAVEGTVVSSEVQQESKTSRSNGTTRRKTGTRTARTKTSYRAEVLYDYVVNGETYSANKVLFGQVGKGSPASARKIVNRYPAGKKVTVYYNPDEPEIAVLEPGATGGTYVLFGVGCVFILFGVVALFGKMR